MRDMTVMVIRRRSDGLFAFVVVAVVAVVAVKPATRCGTRDVSRDRVWSSAVRCAPRRRPTDTLAADAPRKCHNC